MRLGVLVLAILVAAPAARADTYPVDPSAGQRLTSHHVTDAHPCPDGTARARLANLLDRKIAIRLGNHAVHVTSPDQPDGKKNIWMADGFNSGDPTHLRYIGRWQAVPMTSVLVTVVVDASLCRGTDPHACLYEAIVQISVIQHFTVAGQGSSSELACYEAWRGTIQGERDHAREEAPRR